MPAAPSTVGAVTNDAAAPEPFFDAKIAAATARRLMSAGPQVELAEATQMVAQLADLAEQSVPQVAKAAGKNAPEPVAGAQILDRNRWVQMNLRAFAQLLQPAVLELAAANRLPKARTLAATRKITGAQIGAVLAFAGTKVLGQYDPYGSDPGTLYLVAPNIMAIEQLLGVDPEPFRHWVCLHEETHRWQFTMAPWLKGHLQNQVTELAQSTLGSAQDLPNRLATAVAALPRVLQPGSNGIAELVQGAPQRELLAQSTAVMALLEGHADVVMDTAGAAVLPDVAHLRKRFTQYRQQRGSLDTLLRRIMGFDAKMRQYSAGAYFVREVQQQVGVAGFNVVFDAPENLPTAAEINAPELWVQRVARGDC